MSQATANNFSIAELAVISYVGKCIAKDPKSYRRVIRDNFQNPDGLRKRDIEEIEKILDDTLGKNSKLSPAINRLEDAANNFCRVVGENIRRNLTKNVR